MFHVACISKHQPFPLVTELLHKLKKMWGTMPIILSSSLYYVGIKCELKGRHTWKIFPSVAILQSVGSIKPENLNYLSNSKNMYRYFWKWKLFQGLEEILWAWMCSQLSGQPGWPFQISAWCGETVDIRSNQVKTDSLSLRKHVWKRRGGMAMLCVKNTYTLSGKCICLKTLNYKLLRVTAFLPFSLSFLVHSYLNSVSSQTDIFLCWSFLR